MFEALAAGIILNDRFKITQFVSQDSIGGIYRVIDVKITERTYTLREFFPPSMTPEERSHLEKQFTETTAFYKTLEHPNLVRLVDSFIEGNRFYVVTELVEGLSLSALAALSPNATAEPRVLEWLVQACQALNYAHHRAPPVFLRIIHPDAMILDRDGNLKLDGFGFPLLFASAAKLDDPNTAPEISTWEDASVQADLYGLGASVYRLLTGREWGQSTEGQIPAGFSDRTKELLSGCLRADPALRPKDAGDLLEVLDDMLHPKTPKVSIRKKTRRQRLVERTEEPLRKIKKAVKAILTRPYLIALAALVVWAGFKSFRTETFKHFHKTGPLMIVACEHEVDVVDLTNMKITDELTEIEQGKFTALSPDAAQVWIANEIGRIFEINAENGLMGTQFSVRQPVGGIAKSEKNLLFLTLDRDNALGIFSSTAGKAVAFSPTGKSPGEVALNDTQKEIYVISVSPKALSVFDSTSYALKQTISLEASPTHLVQSPDGKSLYITYANLLKVDVFDTETKSRLTEIPMADPGPYAISTYANGCVITTPKRSKIAVIEYPGGIHRLDVFLDKPQKTVYDTSSNRLYVITSNGYLYMINSTTGKIVNHVKLAKLPSDMIFIP